MTLAAPAPSAALPAGDSLLHAVASARERFVQAGVADGEATADAEFLARHALGWDRATWLAQRRQAAPAEFTARYKPLVARRERREPVSQITGEREFWGLRFVVEPTVLTPRPETELIVETALDVLADRRDYPVVLADIGTGSGCLAVALAREFRRAAVTAVDRSADALNVARRNAAAHGVENRIAWVHAPFDAWLGNSRGSATRFDLIVANLPYVPSADIDSLAPEVRDHEPRMALDGGSDGLDPLRTLLRSWHRTGMSATYLLVEMGAGQADAVHSLVDTAAGFDFIDMRIDLQGIPRVAVIRTTARRILPSGGDTYHG